MYDVWKIKVMYLVIGFFTKFLSIKGILETFVLIAYFKSSSLILLIILCISGCKNGSPQLYKLITVLLLIIFLSIRLAKVFLNVSTFILLPPPILFIPPWQ